MTTLARRLGAPLSACLLALALAPAPALAHDGESTTASVAGLDAGAPTVTSSNVRKIAGIPETTAISMEFARTGPYAYVSSLDTISVLDLTDPRKPVQRGSVVNALFENEAMTYGERKIDGQLVRFVIAAVDLVQASPSDPTHVNVDDGPQVVLVDVTDPDKPFLRSRTPLSGAGDVTTSTHTVQCVLATDCRYAYSAGTGSKFSIIDLTDLDNPRQLKTVPSPASGPGKDGFRGGAGHYWDFDGTLGWHTGSGGAAAFDVTDPVNPLIVNATNAFGRGAPINDFILHNSMRPNAQAFVPGAEPSIANGNVLLVTEEDYFDDGDELDCTKSGSFQTWHVPDLDGAAYRLRNPGGTTQDVGTVAPLDQVNAPAEFGGGLSTPVTAFCSAHWFDVHQSGVVAVAQYGAGVQLLDVRDARNIGQYGYITGTATQVWDAYWVPQRNKQGVAHASKKTNILYTADAVRGIEVFEVDLGAGAAEPGVLPLDLAASTGPAGVGVAGALLGALVLSAGVGAVRRRRA